jgi:hypothetical protein
MLGVFAAASDEGCTIVARSIGNSSSVVRRPSLAGVARRPEGAMTQAGGSWAMSNTESVRLRLGIERLTTNGTVSKLAMS